MKTVRTYAETIDDISIVYVPEVDRVFVVDSSQNSLIPQTVAIPENEVRWSQRDESNEKTATDLVLLLTSACNLACNYCYSSAGDGAHVMSEECAKSAILHILNSAKDAGKPGISILFLGEGEPTANWEVLTASVSYARSIAKSAGIDIRFSIGTNGVFGDEKRQYLAKNMDNITVSLDGPRFIHDKQRPQANSKSTFQRTFATANYFYQYRNKLNFGLRATLTPEYIDYLPELVRFVGLHFPKAQFSVEPVEFVGRFSEHPRDMFKNLAFSYRKARLEAVRHGLCFWYSVVRGPRKSDFFCGIAGRTMMVGPTGAITGCSRVSRPSFTGASHFIYGNVNTKSHVITIDKNAKARMETYAATNMSECDGCIAFTWCRGDCRHIRFMENKDILSGVSSRCREIRTIVVGELLDAAGFPDTDTYLNHYYTTTAGIRLNNEKINDEVSPAGNFMFNNRKIAIAR